LRSRSKMSASFDKPSLCSSSKDCKVSNFCWICQNYHIIYQIMTQLWARKIMGNVKTMKMGMAVTDHKEQNWHNTVNAICNVFLIYLSSFTCWLVAYMKLIHI
jgi:hypothetical protein